MISEITGRKTRLSVPRALTSLAIPFAVRDLQWEQPLQIIKYPDPRLRAVNARIGKFDAKLEQLGKEMLEVMYNG